ncbi:MAG: hypothetical protein AB7S68_36040 [Polyangiaceae bacterium]
MSEAQGPVRTYPDEAALRAEAVRIASYACDGDRGRVEGDPVFDSVTEGRQHNKGYSACGDLPHYMLRELGIRDERLLNRDDDDGVIPWRMGKNLSRIVFSAGGAFVWAWGKKRPKPGDVLYMSKPEHVAVLEELDEAKGTIAVLEYGQFDKVRGKHLGIRHVKPFQVLKNTIKIGKCTLHGWLDLSKLKGLIVPRKEPEPPPPKPAVCASCPYA